MRGIHYQAAFGTVLIFIGIYCFKALFSKKVSKEETHGPAKSALTNQQKIILVACGVVAIIAGILLIIKEINLISRA